MFKSLTALVFLCGTAATAQSVSYSTNNPSLLKGDPNKLVCEKEDKIGTRLGGERVCHTVAEWNQMREGARENTERLQAGTWAPCGDGTCGANAMSVGDIPSPH